MSQSKYKVQADYDIDCKQGISEYKINPPIFNFWYFMHNNIC